MARSLLADACVLVCCLCAVHVDETQVPVDYTQDYRRYSYTDYELNGVPIDGKGSIEPSVSQPRLAHMTALVGRACSVVRKW